MLGSGLLRALRPRSETDLPFLVTVGCLLLSALLPPPPHALSGPLCEPASLMGAAERLLRALLFALLYVTHVYAHANAQRAQRAFGVHHSRRRRVGVGAGRPLFPAGRGAAAGCLGPLVPVWDGGSATRPWAPRRPWTMPRWACWPRCRPTPTRWRRARACWPDPLAALAPAPRNGEDDTPGRTSHDGETLDAAALAVLSTRATQAHAAKSLSRQTGSMFQLQPMDDKVSPERMAEIAQTL